MSLAWMSEFMIIELTIFEASTVDQDIKEWWSPVICEAISSLLFTLLFSRVESTTRLQLTSLNLNRLYLISLWFVIDPLNVVFPLLIFSPPHSCPNLLFVSGVVSWASWSLTNKNMRRQMFRFVADAFFILVKNIQRLWIPSLHIDTEHCMTMNSPISFQQWSIVLKF